MDIEKTSISKTEGYTISTLNSVSIVIIIVGIVLSCFPLFTEFNYIFTILCIPTILVGLLFWYFDLALQGFMNNNTKLKNYQTILSILLLITCAIYLILVFL